MLGSASAARMNDARNILGPTALELVAIPAAIFWSPARRNYAKTCVRRQSVKCNQELLIFRRLLRPAVGEGIGHAATPEGVSFLAGRCAGRAAARRSRH